MYWPAEETVRNRPNEISDLFPDNYCLVRMDNRREMHPVCEVLYIGDNFSELFGVQVDMEDSHLVVIPGRNINIRNSWGGIVRVP